jgi:osmotically-inducible protein OsmY
VVLAGSVPSYPQYLQAAAVARRVAGVKDVRNDLKVALPAGDHRDDSALTATANDALTLGHTVTVGVEAAAKNGDITLTGAVRHGVTNDIEIRDDADPLYPEPGKLPGVSP